MPGPWEWVFILLIVFIIFGAGKLPQVGEALGKSIRSFKRASGGEDSTAPKPPDTSTTDSSGDKPKPS
jgi:sec-independent protein translocase protein TatA